MHSTSFSPRHGSSRATRRLVLAVLTLLLAVAAAPGVASAAMGVSKLRAGGPLGTENYLYTAGDSVFATGSVDAGSYYRFVVSDPSAVAHSTSTCAAAPANNAVSGSYVVQAGDPVSTSTAWRFQLQQFATAGCAGAPAKSASLYFDVVSATAYSGSSLVTPKAFFTVGQTAYVKLLGVGKVKASPTNAAVTDWSTAWLLPSSATACANTGGGDRPDSTAGGFFPTGTGPLGTGGYLQYRPNVVATGDAWNRESNYETRPCPDFAAGNQGVWRLKLKRDNTHFVTLPVLTIDTTPPDTSVTGGPAGPTNSTQATLNFSSTESSSTFECRLDGGSWTSCSAPKSYLGLSEGAHSFDVRATDQAGNTDPSPATRPWSVDTTLPAVALATPADGSSMNDATPTFSGTAGTDAGDSPTVLVSVFSGTDVSGPPVETVTATVAGGGTWSVDASPALADGTYTAYAQQSDAAANTSFSEEHTFTIDATAPRVRLAVPVADAVTSDTSVDLRGTAGNLFGDDNEVTVRIYAGATASGSPLQSLPATPDADGRWTASASPDLAEGVYTARAEQDDFSGNTGYSPAHTFTVDTTPPTTTITAGPAGPTASTTASFRFVSSQSGSSFECRLDNSVWGSCSAPKAYFNLAAGAHTFDVRAADGAGNVDPNPAGRSWTIDPSLPAVSVSSPADGSATNDTTPTFAGSAGTAPGDAAVVTVKIYGVVNGGSPVLVETTTAARGAGGFWTVDASAALAEGDYAVHAEQSGASGTGYSVEHAFTVDTTSPDTFITLGPFGATSTSGASFRFASSEPASTFQCRLDGGSWAACSSPRDYSSLTPGSHTFDVRAIDKAGNVDPAPVTRTWTVDPTLPVINISIPVEDSYTNDDTPLFSGIAGRATGDGATVTVEIYRPVAGAPDQLVETRSAFRSSFDGTWAVAAFPGLDEGAYIVRAGQAGTSGTGYSAPRTFTVDETPPATSITVGPLGTTTATDTHFRFVSSEAGSTFQCRLDGSVWTGCSSPAAYSGLSADSHAFDVRAVDAAGNVDPFGDTRTWVVDPTVPPVVMTAPAEDSWTNDATPTFAGNAGIAVGDSDTVTIEVYDGTSVSDDPVEVLTTTRSSLDGSWSVNASPALPDGTYAAFASQSDGAANTGVSAARTFTVDTTPSLVSLAQPVSGSVGADATPTVSGTAGTVEGDSATVTLTVYSGGAVVRVLTATRSDAGAWSVDVSPALADGTYSVRAEQNDLAGNTGSSAAVAFSVDTTAPGVTVTAPADGALTSDATPTLAGQAGAAAGDSASVLVDVSRGGTAVATLTATRAAGSWTIDFPSALADGTYTVSARQSDAVGNLGVSPSRTFTIDTTAPETSLTGGPTDSTTATDASFAFSSSEPSSTFECRLDGGNWGACSSPRSHTGLALGAHVFDVRATDATGNVDSSPASRAWTIVAGPAPAPVPQQVSLALKLDRPKAKSLLKKGKIVFYAKCDSACKLTVSSKIAVPQGRKARLFQNKKLTVTLAAGKRTMLKLTLSKKAKAAVQKALRLHKKVTVKLAGTATGASSSKASAKLTFSARH